MKREVYKKHSRSTLTDVMVGSVLLLLASPSYAEDSRQSRIENSGELKVCVWPEYFAISYRNNKNGSHPGTGYRYGPGIV